MPPVRWGSNHPDVSPRWEKARESSWLLDRNHPAITLMLFRRPFDEDPTVLTSRDAIRSMKIPIAIHAVLHNCRNHERSRSFDEAVIKPRWRSDAPGSSTFHQVSPRLSFTYSLFGHVLLMEIGSTPCHLHRRISSDACGSDVRWAATCPA